MMLLPLFPLGSVLFPGMPIRLHIFEERYKEMINECIDNQSPFGIVLLQQGTAEFDRSVKPYLVGTTAYISQVQRLQDGRMTILAIGRDRFKINKLDSTSRSFLQGEVDLLPLVNVDSSILQNGVEKLRPLLERYLTSFSNAGQVQFDLSQLPDEPLSIAFLAAVLLQTEDEVKQDILESVDTYALMTTLLRIYHKEVTLLDILESPPDLEIENDTPFSLS